MSHELPPPLPPETRTVGQLVAETIRFYQAHFWRVLPLGLVIAVVEQITAGWTTAAQTLFVAAVSPAMAFAYARAASLLSGRPVSRTAVLAGTLIFLPVPFLMRFYLLPAAAWLAFVGLAVPAAVIEGLGFRSALVRGRVLARADFVHALGSVATLAILFGLARGVLVLLLQGQADVAVRTALFLADLVLSPMLFVGSALLYWDQAARDVDSPHAALHPPVDPVDPGRPDAEGEPRPAAGSQP